MKLRINSIYHKIIILLFISVLAAPLIGMFFNINSRFHRNEKLIFEEMPAFPHDLISLNRFPSRFDRYINDNFGFRVVLIKLHNLLKFNLLNVSPIPDVIFGKESGWLFYAADNVIDDYQGHVPLSETDLEHMRKIAEERYYYLKKQGTRYLIVIPPNKISVYPDYAPKWIIKGKTRLEQFMDYMKKHNSPVKILYLKNALLDKLDGALLYLKADTHMNFFGGYYASKFISQELKLFLPSIPPFPPVSDYEFVETEYCENDMAIIMQIDERKYFVEDIKILDHSRIQNFKFQKPGVFYYDNYYNDIKNGDLVILENKNKQIPRAVIYHDSFMGAIQYYLVNNFSRMVLQWQRNGKTGFDSKIINHEKPDIVIQEFVERSLTSLLRQNPDEIRNY